MIVFRSSGDLREWCLAERDKGRSIGFVPTMGALHTGHLSLVKQAMELCDVALASIFVNPTQFNDPDDFRKYPVAVEEDREMLRDAGCHALFLPDMDEVYPDGTGSAPVVDLGYLGKCLEAEKRPGHFEGVLQVVHRLLDITGPVTLFMGSKDQQQYLVVKKLVESFGLPVRVRPCPVIRESDGLAMSSRNRRLSLEGRRAAVMLSRTIFDVARNWRNASPEQLIGEYSTKIGQHPLVELEYLEIVDSETLMPVQDWGSCRSATVFIAAVVDGIRLIDNTSIY